MLAVPVVQKYYVYVYEYPSGYTSENGDDLSGQVFYVGKGTGDRWKEHLRLGSSKNVNDRKKDVISRIRQMGFDVVVKKLAYFDREVDAFLYEWATMIAYQAHLTNMRLDIGAGGWECYERNGSKMLGDEVYLNSSEASRFLGVFRNTFNTSIRTCLTEYELDKSRQVYFKKSDLLTWTEKRKMVVYTEPLPENEDALGTYEAISYLGITRRTLERYIEQGRLTRYKRGTRRNIFRQSELDQLRMIRPEK